MKKIICVFVLFNALFYTYAQNNVTDSLRKLIATVKEDTNRVRQINSLSIYYLRKRHNADSALLYEQQGLELSRKINYRAGEVNALAYIGWIQYKLGQQDASLKTTWLGLAIHDKFLPNDIELQLYLWENLATAYTDSKPDSCIYYSEKMLKLAQASGNILQEATAFETLGFEFLFLGNYPKALDMSLKEQAVVELNKDTLDIAYCDREMGNVYLFLNNYDKALEYYNAAQSLAKTITTDSAQYLFCGIYLSKARLFVKINNLDSSLYYARLSYDLSEKIYNNLIIARLLYLLGDIYEKKGNDTLALKYFRQGITFSKDHDFLSTTIEASNSLARYFCNKKVIDSSIFYAMKSVDVIHSSGFIIDAPETYNILASAYTERKNIDSTIKYKDLFQSSKDTLLGINRIQQVQQILFNQEQQRKQEQASVLAYKNGVRFYTLLAGLIVIVLIASLLFRNNRSKQKAYNLLQKQKAETDLQRDKTNKALNDLKSTQSQLIQSEKMASLGVLTAGIAHEIQNPLNFVNNFSEVNTELIAELKQEIDKGNLTAVKAIANDIQENEEKINHHGKRADSIVKGMLQHNRTTSAEKEPTDINKIADEYLRLSYHGLRAKDNTFNVTMKTDFDKTIGKINIIPQDIGRVLLNLYNNAFYAAPLPPKGGFKDPDYKHEPTVWVSTKKIGNIVEVKVKDNGSGIPQNILDKIFQPFFTTKPTGQGTGLGLSLSYDIVKAHGGEIKVESKEGEGAEFIIQLPLI